MERAACRNTLPTSPPPLISISFEERWVTWSMVTTSSTSSMTTSSTRFLYDVPGWPRVIQGRTDLMAAFRGYVDNIALQSADQLIAHKTDGGRVIVIEYAVHGTILATGVKYDNRFCSIIKIEDRRITHWRDYMDSLAAWNALTAQARG
jgi:ketosteroid isomerase-like protein